MPNYEELYNIAKRNFNNAVEDRNAKRRQSAEIQGDNKQLLKEIEELQDALEKIERKENLLKDAMNACEKILNPEGEFQNSKKWIIEASTEYKSIFESDLGVANIQVVYNYDNSSCETQKELEESLISLRKIYEEYTAAKEATQKDLQGKNSTYIKNNKKISSLQIEEAYIQKKINYFYGEMEVAKKKWAAQGLN